VDAPDFHDGDDRAGRRAIGKRDVRAHLAVAQPYAHLAGFHQLRLSKARALPEKIFCFSAAETSSEFTARIVSRISMPPCSASNGASVANRQCPVPKNSWPQRVAEAEPFSAVSA